MSDLTPERLVEIARVTEAASPAPWTLSRVKYGHADVRSAEHDMLAKGCDATDAAFIALARTVIPELLAALTAKDEEIERLREVLERERIATTAAANRGWRCGP